jgi:ketosteroid isomerase-like protein
MRFAILTLLFFSLSITALGQKAGRGAKADPTAGVRAAFDRLVDGIKRVDAEQVMSVYHKSERLLIYNNNGTATNGWDNVNANVIATYEKLSNVTLDITGLRIEMLGTKAAVLTCKWKQTQDNDGTTESASGRMTLLFKLVGKDWKITHRHTSPDKPDATRPVFPSEREG